MRGHDVERENAFSATGQSRRRILVVDDSEDAAELLAAALEAMGHETATAFDGPSAVSRAIEFRPEAALVDIGLPGMDGFEVAGQLRRCPELSAVKLVALTGYGRPSDRRQSAEAGFEHHMVKPVDLDALRQLLAGLFD